MTGMVRPINEENKKTAQAQNHHRLPWQVPVMPDGQSSGVNIFIFCNSAGQ